MSRQGRNNSGVRTKVRRAFRSTLHLAWDVGLPHRNPDPTYRGSPFTGPLLAVLGMHRSGTSAVSGMLEDQGFSTGVAPEERQADNPFGTRENRDLVRLDRAILEINGGDWDRPPTRSGLRFSRGYLRRRDQLIASIVMGPTVLKDPRMVLLKEFWDGIPLMPIGVIRNPVAVTESLQRREGRLNQYECLRIWHTYNSHLLRWLESKAFPVIEFEGTRDLATELTLALAHYGQAAPNSFEFFDPSLVRADDTAVRWRQTVPAVFSDLWDKILPRFRPEPPGKRRPSP